MPYMPERICETAAIDVERPDLSGREKAAEVIRQQYGAATMPG